MGIEQRELTIWKSGERRKNIGKKQRENKIRMEVKGYQREREN